MFSHYYPRRLSLDSVNTGEADAIIDKSANQSMLTLSNFRLQNYRLEKNITGRIWTINLELINFQMVWN